MDMIVKFHDQLTSGGADFAELARAESHCSRCGVPASGVSKGSTTKALAACGSRLFDSSENAWLTSECGSAHLQCEGWWRPWVFWPRDDATAIRGSHLCAARGRSEWTGGD